MNRLKPCKRREFINKLRKLGFKGPFSGGKHHFMIYEKKRLAIPSNDEYSVPQLRLMLREVSNILQREITIIEWNSINI
jgi:predicted RNA binding protein YcfA (HicA-like mRNA interferase family)